jgi:hypothetical protein
VRIGSIGGAQSLVSQYLDDRIDMWVDGREPRKRRVHNLAR